MENAPRAARPNKGPMLFALGLWPGFACPGPLGHTIDESQRPPPPPANNLCTSWTSTLG